MENKPPQTPESQRLQDSLLPPVDADADIIISDDEQSAYLGIRPPKNGGRDLSYDEIIAELEKRRIIYGVKQEVVALLATQPKYSTMQLVAQGTQPVQGEDAKLTFHFSFNREVKPKEREDGTVDYRDLGLIEAVTEGQKLCTLTPAIKGMPGKTVTGKVILPNPVRNFGLPAGKNTKFSEDKLELLAAIGGSAEYVNNKVQVNNVFTINGDVCNATGNISFDGSVIVNGDVLSGFTVKAAGNISVVGNVEGAVLEAGGSIKIVAGLVGQGRGRATCGGDFKALFVENAEVYAKGNVTADVFMHSQIRCGGSLLTEGRRGAVIGGNYMVGKDVRVLTVGTQSGVPTIFELGVDPTIMDRMKFITERTRVINNELAKLNQIIKLLYPMKLNNKLPQDKADMLEKAVMTKDSHVLELEELTSEREGYCAESGGLITSQFICRRELYFGTKVSICQIPYTVPSDLVRCKIYLSPSKEINMTSF